MLSKVMTAVDVLATPEKEIPKEDFYLTGSLTFDEEVKLERLYKTPMDKMERTASILTELAEMRGKKISPIVLRTPQILPVLLSYVNKRFFIGDKPGLGKTVMSAGSYALYCMQELKRERKPKKIIVVTVSSHIIGFQKEWESFGLDLLPLVNGTQNIRRTLKNNDLNDYDGVILNWSGLSTNGFLDFYLEHHDEFQYAVFDETTTLLNPKSMTYQVVDEIVNNFQNGIERVLFLNGSSFKKDLFDFYHQFNILEPKLIPSKKFLEDRYIIRGGRNHYVNEVVNIGGAVSSEVVRRKTGAIESYRNQEELKKRLKYYYIARSKSDYSDSLPEHNYVLHPIELSTTQREQLKESFNISVINSPSTSNPNVKLTRSNSMKLDSIISFADEVSSDRPILYVYNRESQKVVVKELEKLGYKVGLLNGEITKSEERNKIVSDFNNKKYDMLVFNIINAINLPTSDRILFYDIPTMPETTTQIVGRIDRNNYEDKKFYDFFCYLDSPEMINLIKLSCFREYHSNKFTGQYVSIYGMLVAQLTRHIGDERMEEMQKVIDNMYESNQTFEEVTETLQNLVGI